MAPSDDSAYRSLQHRAAGDDITVRDGEELDTDDGVFEIRMPIASTGEVRNEGDEPLRRRELEGFARQINDRAIGVFPAHGDDDTIANGHYSPFERLGDWRDGEFVARSEDGDDGVLMATARMPDPESLPQTTGNYREGLAILKEQAKRGIAQDASIGWRTDESFPGGNDLMEASIVGIGADWRTNTDDEAAVVAREAVAAGADPAELVDRVKRAVTPDDARPFGPPGGDPEKWDDFDECVSDVEDWDDIDDPEAFCGWAESQTKDARAEYEVGDETIDITPPDDMVNAADLAMEKSADGLGSDCGTGRGDERADQIRNDEVGPDVVAEVAAYLTSHEEDVSADGPPSEWSDEEWDDCGNIQYAKWGGTGSGDPLAWAQEHANAVAEARGEELPYPDRAARNLDDPAFGEGDAVAWDWQGDTVHGRVAGDPAESVTVAGQEITGDDGEAVYPIHEYDDEVEAFRRRNVAKAESSLDESGRDLPPATEENFQDMSDSDAADSDPPDGGTTDDAQDAPDDGDGTTRAPADIDEPDVAEFVSELYDGVDAADIEAAMSDAGAEFAGLDAETASWFVADILDVTADEVMDMMDATDGEGEMSDDEDDEEEDDDGDMDADDPDDTQSMGEEALDAVEALREEFREFREAGGEAERPDRGVDDTDTDTDTDDKADRAAEATTDGPNWRA